MTHRQPLHEGQILPPLPPPLQENAFAPRVYSQRDDDDDGPDDKFQRRWPTAGPDTSRSTPTTKDAINALYQSVSAQDRWQALQMARNVFSHSRTDLHDYEVRLGADRALCLKLGYVVAGSVNRSDNEWTKNQQEISLICQCLCKIYECSRDIRQGSYRNLGRTELMPLLCTVWERYSPARLDAVSGDNFSVAISVLLLFRTYAKIDEASKHDLIVWKDGDLLSSTIQLTSLLTSDLFSGNMEDGGVQRNFVFELWGLLKDLTFRSHPEDKDTILLGVAGSSTWHLLVETIDRVMEHPDEKLVEYITAILWNLALAKKSSLALLRSPETQGPHLKVIAFLCRVVAPLPPSDEEKLARPGDKRGRPDSMLFAFSTKSRRNAISAAGNIATEEENQRILFSADVVERLPLIVLLQQVCQQESDSVVRRRAMRSLRCLTTSRTVQDLSAISESSLVDFFIDSIRQRNVEEDDNERDAQLQAFQALQSILERQDSGLIDPNQWPRLETVLVSRMQSLSDPVLMSVMCGCLAHCFEKSPWRRNGLVGLPPQIWYVIHESVAASTKCHCQVSRLLLLMAKSESRHDMSRKSELAHEHVLTTLSLLVDKAPDPNLRLDSSRYDAIEVVLELIKNPLNKKALADNEGLLSALVNFCLVEPDGPPKSSAKQAIIDLVPEI